MTSGYADYVYTPEILRGTVLQPFRQWTSQELIRIGTSKRGATPAIFASIANALEPGMVHLPKT